MKKVQGTTDRLFRDIAGSPKPMKTDHCAFTNTSDRFQKEQESIVWRRKSAPCYTLNQVASFEISKDSGFGCQM